MLLFIVFLLLNFFSVFTTVSIIGVILGVAALSVVLSVTSGFQSSFKAKVLGVNAHVLVLKYGLDFSEYRDVMEKCAKEEHVKAVAPFVFNEMMIARGPALSGVLIKGIDVARSPQVLDIAEKLDEREDGRPRDAAAADGRRGALARDLHRQGAAEEAQGQARRSRARGLAEGRPRPGAVGALGRRQPIVARVSRRGIFYSGFDEYDRRLAYVTLKRRRRSSRRATW